MPRDDAPPPAWKARLALEFERRAGRTVLASRRHDGPLVVQKPFYPEGGEVCHAIVVHPPAGIAAGDELVIEVCARRHAATLLTTPGAGKWYRSAGVWASQRVKLEAAASSAVEWLPQETIVYDGARADLSWEAHLEGDARLVAWDIVSFGRTESGERFAAGHFRSAARVVRDGRLAWIERGRVEPGSAMAESPAGLGGCPVAATMVVAAPAIDDAWLALARESAPREGEGAVTRLPGVLLARYRGGSTEAAREYFASIWRALREPVLGRVPVAPRIWST